MDVLSTGLEVTRHVCVFLFFFVHRYGEGGAAAAHLSVFACSTGGLSRKRRLTASEEENRN